jgi:hypothetical protein
VTLKTLFLIEVQSSNVMVHSNESMHSFVELPNNSTMKAIDTGVSADADISSFLTRRVKIVTYQWGVGGHLGQTFDPWALYLANPAVKNKLQNYQLLKANLKLTFLINGTPFHKGMALASYSYLNVTNEKIVVGGDLQLVTCSQRPHVYLNPSTNKGGCICVPFFVPTNYLSLTSAVISSSDIGSVSLYSFQALQQINAGTDTVTVTVFAELTDVKLTAPTMKAVALSGTSNESFDIFRIEVQSSKDEYKEKDGVVSGPASALANAAGALSTIPGIGPYAMATQIGANAVGSIARLFGFSKPIQLADTTRMYNTPFANLASTEGADMSQKLTLTGKQEITIDPRTVDLPDSDCLAILPFAQRETYITKFSWGVADTVDTTLFAMDVDPMAERRASASTLGYQITPTSLSYLSRPFAEWSGSLKYRFQIIASQYHRGRIAIIYDPTGPLTGDPYNVTYNTIIDLAEGRDFTVEFKWQRDRAYLSIDTDDTRTFWTEVTPDARTPDLAYANGIFYVVVVNELVVPDGVTDVEVLVSMSAGEDFELVNPMGGAIEVSPFLPIEPESGSSSEDFSRFFKIETQSSVDVVPTGENTPEGEINQMDVTTGVLSDDSEKPLVFYGEKITSIRQLLKRYCHFRLISQQTSAVTRTLDYYLLRQMPGMPGYDPNGPDVTGGGAAYLYANNNYINYYKQCFAGWRGSIRWKFLPVSNCEYVYVDRATGAAQRAAVVNYRRSATFPIIANQGTAVTAYAGVSAHKYSGAGCATTPCRTMNALEIEVPYHLPIRFSKTYGEFLPVDTNTLANGYPGGDSFHFAGASAVNNSQVLFDTYVAGGEDLTFFGFVGAPTFYSAPLPAA